MPRDRRAITEATVVAAIFSGAPSTLYTLYTSRSPRATRAYVLDATRAIGTLVPPGRPGLVRGSIIHASISVAVGEALARALPERHSVAWAAAAGLGLGVVDIGIIGRRFPAIRALPLIPQLADHVAFGSLFALVADRRRAR